ncbi:MAG: ABC transporter ATP-binding protein [Bradyrhizobium sp.]|nr:MAG: ABC transporter ATP-binding protein [Bradyrhizobium sp.]
MRIVASGLTLGYGGRPALAGVDCALETGQLVGLIGPNGAGKSTLLRVLAGLQTADAGEVRYDGQAAKQIGRAALARRVAYLTQSGVAHWPLSVAHVVALGRLAHRRAFASPSAADRAAIEKALAAAELGDLRDRSIATLSGGERSRALLARALVVEADMLLADEPAAALDPLHQLRTMELLRNAAREGTGVVAVLHDLTLAARFCDRLIVLARGRIVADGPPAALTDAVLAEAYGVTALRGERDGEPYLLPWRPAAPAAF